MSFLLDGETVMAHLKNHAVVRGHVRQHRGSLYLSVVTLAELEMWLLNPQTPANYTQDLDKFLSDVTLIDVNRKIAERTGRIGARGWSLGFRLTTADLLVVATAIQEKLTLVTPDIPHYSRIPGLTVVNWMVP